MSPRGQRDLELLKRVLAGESQARDEFGRRMVCALHHLEWINLKAGCPLRSDDLDEICGRVQARVWEKRSSFAGHSSLEKWVQGFCFREFQRFRRERAGDKKRRIETELLDQLIARDPEEHSDALAKYYRVLTPQQRRIVYLVYEMDLELDEVGAALGITVNTVKTQQGRALGTLRNTGRDPADGEDDS